MFEGLTHVIMSILDPIGVVIGIVLALPIFWTWYEVTFGRKRRERKVLELVRSSPGQLPGIFIVDLLPERDICTQVENFRMQNERLKLIPNERVFVLSRNKRLQPDDMTNFVQELRSDIAGLLKAGVDLAHLFYAGPTIIPAVIGAEFANSCRVLLWHHDQGSYLNYGPLRHTWH